MVTSPSQRLITTVATPLPIKLVMALHSLINRSMPINSESDSMGIDGTVAKVAASVMNPAPVTPLEPLKISLPLKEELFAGQDLVAY